MRAHRVATILGLALLLVLGVSCSDGKKSPAGFRLPDGDAEQGFATFLEFQCNGCHTVKGLDLPAADVQHPVRLGGEFPYVHTDGDLVTAIIHPSHKITRGYPKREVSEDGQSRMKEYNDNLTVRELVDLVAFLHNQYKLVPAPTYGY